MTVPGTLLPRGSPVNDRLQDRQNRPCTTHLGRFRIAVPRSLSTKPSPPFNEQNEANPLGAVPDKPSLPTDTPLK
jgi:hypothetical protein